MYNYSIELQMYGKEYFFIFGVARNTGIQGAFKC